MKKKKISQKLTVSKNTISRLQKEDIKGGLELTDPRIAACFTHPMNCIRWTVNDLRCQDDTPSNGNICVSG
ncbi:hypothetical protein [Ascidiimonas aurantiaca]|uniref:hypothetical protein n=1 Tax=Ascidiimonas aurantiaca TaxID=1685432 RepID=UPI0030EE5AC2